jgi:hypothetical protein
MRADEEVATLAGQQLEQNRFVSTRDTFIRDVSSAE